MCDKGQGYSRIKCIRVEDNTFILKINAKTNKYNVDNNDELVHDKY